VVDAISHLYPNQALPLLVAACNDSDCRVRESAVDELDHISAVDAVSTIQTLLNDRHHAVRQAAQTALMNFERKTREE
jgi:HEAT repeat protein